METREEIRQEINRRINSIQFLSPNEPLTATGINRILDQMDVCVNDLQSFVGNNGKSITMWNPNVMYSEGDIVLDFKEVKFQKSSESGTQSLAFMLVSTKDDNDNVPNYDLVDGIPDFTKSGWKLLNPMSYLLQDIVGMKNVVREAFERVLSEHVESEHGLVGSESIQENLLRKDYANLTTPWAVGEYSLVRDTFESSDGNVRRKLSSNGIMEYQMKYSFDEKANPYIKIDDRKYYYQKSPIWDESDHSIFSQKYTEEDLFSVTVNERKMLLENGEVRTVFTKFSNLRYGTNVFHKRIDFSMPFADDEYMVFFDTYGNGEFAFGYDRHDLHERKEPTYDAVVSMPMLLNKTAGGFDIVLPIHSYFNSIQKYNVGVPWNNVFTVQAIGRYR